MRDFMACLRKTTEMDARIDAGWSVGDDLAPIPRCGEAFSVEVTLSGPDGAMSSGVDVRYRDVVLSPRADGGYSVWSCELPGSARFAGATLPGPYVPEDAYGPSPLETQLGLMLLALDAGVDPRSPDRLSLRAITAAAEKRDISATAELAVETLGLEPERGTVIWDPALERVLGAAAFEEAFRALEAEVSRLCEGEEMLFVDAAAAFDPAEPAAQLARYSDCASLPALAAATGLLPRGARLVDEGGALTVRGLGGEEVAACLVPEGTPRATAAELLDAYAASREPELARWLGVGPGDEGPAPDPPPGPSSPNPSLTEQARGAGEAARARVAGPARNEVAFERSEER